MKGHRMVRKIIGFACLLALGGCISLGGDAPPQHTTIVVPQGSSVSCVNHDGSPCQPQ
jgi:hypothetical protein